MALTGEDLQAIKDILATEDTLDRWRLRAQEVEEPQPLSDLAIDDGVFPDLSISLITRSSLVHAGEHLRLALDAIHREQIYPSAHFSVLRGALVGASQGVWILHPSERELRRRRGLSIIAEMFDQQGKYYRTLRDSVLVANQDHLNEAEDLVREMEGKLAIARADHGKLNLTDVVSQAARATFSDVAQVDRVKLLWRELSADAHVLEWSVFQRSVFEPFGSDPRVQVGKATGSVSDVALPFLASFQMLKHGWSLFDHRSAAPSETWSEGGIT